MAMAMGLCCWACAGGLWAGGVAESGEIVARVHAEVQGKEIRGALLVVWVAAGMVAAVGMCARMWVRARARDDTAHARARGGPNVDCDNLSGDASASQQ